MTREIILHPDTRLRMLIDLMAENVLTCNLSDLHRINDDISGLVSVVEIDIEAIQQKIDTP
jgi:hypothetical protein